MARDLTEALADPRLISPGTRRNRRTAMAMSHQFGVLLKSNDPEFPDDERRIPLAADSISEAARIAEGMAGDKWRVHQVTDLERD